MSIGDKMVTTGRGGAGNMSSPKLKPTDAHQDTLVTPTLKNTMYTTGRGGSGNMARNDRGEEARKAQDIDPVVRREQATGSIISTGRGGGGNMYRDGKDKKSASPPAAVRGRDKPRQGSGVSDIARDVLQKIRSNSSRRKSSDQASIRSSDSNGSRKTGS